MPKRRRHEERRLQLATRELLLCPQRQLLTPAKPNLSATEIGVRPMRWGWVGLAYVPSEELRCHEHAQHVVSNRVAKNKQIGFRRDMVCSGVITVRSGDPK